MANYIGAEYVGEMYVGDNLNEAPAVALTTPANNATGQSVTPDLIFTGTDPNSDELEYEVQIDTVNTFDSGSYLGGVSASNADLLSETFEGSGFENTGWNESIGTNSGCLVDEDNTDIVRSGGGSQVLKLVNVNIPNATVAGCRAEIDRTITESPIIFLDFYFYVDAITIAVNDEQSLLFGTWDSSWSSAIVLTLYRQSDSKIYPRYNNGADIVFGNELILDHWYHAQIKYDITNHFHCCIIDGVTISSGSLGTGHANNVKYIIIGGENIYTNATIYYGDIKVSSTDFAYPTSGFLDNPDQGDTHPFTSATAVKYTPQVTLNNLTDYYWRVRAKDPSGSGIYGAWSSTNKFTTVALTMHATIDCPASVSGALVAKGKLYGTSNGIATDSGILVAKGKLYGASNGVGSNSGALLGKSRLTGQSNGVGSIGADLKGKGKLYGASTGVGGCSATLVADGKLYGSTNGVSSNSGVLIAKGILLGASIGNSSITGAMLPKGKLIGSTIGVASVEGLLKAKGILSGSLNGVATDSGVLKGKGVLVGVTNGNSSLSGVSIGRGIIIGVVDGNATTSGSIRAKGILLGLSSDIATLEGLLKGKGKLAGQSDGSTELTCLWTSGGTLVSSINTSSSVSGTLQAKGILSGVLSGIGSLAGVLSGSGQLVGIVNGNSSVGGSLLAEGTLQGNSVGLSSVSGILVGKGKLIGQSNGASDVTGYLPTIESSYPIIGSSNSVTTVSGILVAKGKLIGLSASAGIVGGTLGGKADLQGASVGYSEITATLKGKGTLAGQSEGLTTLESLLVLNYIAYWDTDHWAVAKITYRSGSSFISDPVKVYAEDEWQDV